MNRSRNATISSILEKGLSSTRVATKQSAIEALLLYIELDKADPVIDDLLPGLSNKQPKVITATLAAFTTIYHAYGVKVVDPKPVLKALPKAFGHADKNVRAEASNLAVELYRWLREAMKKLLWAELKPVQQQDLEKLFDAVEQEPAPKQERLLRSQQAAAAARPTIAEEDGVDGADDEEEQPAQVDAFDLAEPFDVLSATPKDFHEGLASTKWKERKEALDAFFAVANKDRIKEGPFDEIVQELAKCMKDANIAVVTVAANCVDVLAKGLRKAFAKYRGRIMSPIMERLKEKKQSVADALGQALDSVFGSTGLTDCLEDILEFLKHKNPQVKQETVKFLIRCLRTTRVAPLKPETKSIAEAATKLLTESSEVTRSSGAEALGTLMKIMGERAMGPYLEGLDDIRKTKIKEYFDVAEVKAKDKPKPDAPPPKTAPMPQKKLVSKKPGPIGAKKPAPRAPTPPVEEPVTLQPKPAAVRSIPSKIGNLPKPGIAASGTGLKVPQKLAGPGGSGPSSISSPKRNVSPPTYEDNTAPVPKLGRGLAGRPLNKPGPIPPEPSQHSPPTALSAMEKLELEELRSENERLKTTTESLRSEKSKLASQIHELQNQNAQIIEDHTRDVLSIKAKETQLVRARADAEAAEQLVQKQQREIDRLKRELSRTVRAGSPPPYSASVNDPIYQDTTSNGTARHRSLERYQNSISESRDIGFQRAKTYMSSPSEEKENNSGVKGQGPAPRQKKKVAVTATGENSNSASLTAPPAPLSRTQSGPGRAGREVRRDTERTHREEPGESWKRAASVTTALKHRIELMKVCFLHPSASSFPRSHPKISPIVKELTVVFGFVGKAGDVIAALRPQ